MSTKLYDTTIYHCVCLGSLVAIYFQDLGLSRMDKIASNFDVHL